MTAKKTLPISKLRVDGKTQPRVETDVTVVEEYAAAYTRGDTLPLPVVYFDGERYWLADGFHRRMGDIDAGLKKLRCEVHEGTVEDAQWYSYSANQTHGLRRSNADKARAVKAALHHPHGAEKSDRQIAEHVGVDHKTVGKFRTKLTGEVPQSTTRTGRDGRTINTAKIGKSAERPPADCKSAKAATADSCDDEEYEPEPDAPECEPEPDTFWSDLEDMLRERLDTDGVAVVAARLENLAEKFRQA